MKQKIFGIYLLIIGLMFMACANPSSAPYPSTIVFADGAAVSKFIGSGTYTNATSGEGTGALTYTNGTPETATVDAGTGEVTLAALGTTVLTANRAATATHEAATNSYTLTVTPLLPSTIVFTDGAAVSKFIGSGTYTNAASGEGTGALTYTSKAPGTAAVDANTGEVSLAAIGTTLITASKAATRSHEAVINSYTLTVTNDYSSANIGTMRYVPSGSFQRSRNTGDISKVSDFRMGEKEITRDQFTAILGTDPSDISESSGIKDPVQATNWYHAIAFCNKLSIAEGLTPVYSLSVITDWATLSYNDIPTSNNSDWNAVAASWANNGYRLPTDMEWMWAAMGATSDRYNGNTGVGINTTGYSKEFAGKTESNTIGDFAWIRANTSTTQPAGTKKANELGLHDMSGNVSEWCWDWYAAYPAGPVTDYRGTVEGTERVYHRSAFKTDPAYYIIYMRSRTQSNEGYCDLGFRVVRR